MVKYILFIVSLVLISNICWAEEYVKKFDEAKDRDLIFSLSNSILNDIKKTLTFKELKKSTGITIKVENTYANVAKALNKSTGKEIIISSRIIQPIKYMADAFFYKSEYFIGGDKDLYRYIQYFTNHSRISGKNYSEGIPQDIPPIKRYVDWIGTNYPKNSKAKRDKETSLIEVGALKFIIAHEFGHFIIEHGDTLDKDLEHWDNQLYEAEADLFAFKKMSALDNYLGPFFVILDILALELKGRDHPLPQCRLFASSFYGAKYTLEKEGKEITITPDAKEHFLNAMNDSLKAYVEDDLCIEDDFYELEQFIKI